MDWRNDFEKKMNDLEKKVKLFFDKNRNQIKLVQNIINTYKVKGNISIENYKKY